MSRNTTLEIRRNSSCATLISHEKHHTEALKCVEVPQTSPSSSRNSLTIIIYIYIYISLSDLRSCRNIRIYSKILHTRQEDQIRNRRRPCGRGDHHLDMLWWYSIDLRHYMLYTTSLQTSSSNREILASTLPWSISFTTGWSITTYNKSIRGTNYLSRSSGATWGFWGFSSSVLLHPGIRKGLNGQSTWKSGSITYRIQWIFFLCDI